MLLTALLVLAGLVGWWSAPEEARRVAWTPWVGWLLAVAAGVVAARVALSEGRRAQSRAAIAVMTSGLVAVLAEHFCLARADPGGCFVAVAPLVYLGLVVPLNWWILRSRQYRGATLASLLSGLLFLGGLAALCRYVEVAGPFDWTI